GIFSQKEVVIKLKSKGLGLSKTSFSRILRNSIYHGEIQIKAFRDEPAMTIKGIHEPLITKELFVKVQGIIDAGKPQLGVSHKKINGKFPLKGFILCPECLKPLRASSSKGRKEYYSYYHCKSPCNTRYKLEEVDTCFDGF